MRTFCITLSETPDRRQAAEEHFKARGVKAEFINGIYAQGFGLHTTHTYEHDHPGTGYVISQKHVGLHLSHYMAWTVCSFINDPWFMILEDDAEFPDTHAEWTRSVSTAMCHSQEMDNPADLLLIGSCNCADKPKEDLGNGLFKVDGPQCTHAYIVFKSALQLLLHTQRDSFAPVDLSLILRSYPFLNVVTVLPRIVGQRGQEIGH